MNEQFLVQGLFIGACVVAVCVIGYIAYFLWKHRDWFILSDE